MEIYFTINLKLNIVDSKQVLYRLQLVSGKEIRLSFKNNCNDMNTNIGLLVSWPIIPSRQG
jgi:hypothetical protein